MHSEFQAAEAASVEALAGSLERLEEAVDQEIAALRAHRPVDLQDVTRRKSCALLELTRLARALPAEAGGRLLRDRIARLREKLAENQELLRTHLAAMREIADLLAGVIRDAESDGTYSSSARGWGAAR
jgi:flagellar biosynthesis/type III secretory pathway chaperone